jgi:AAA domain
MAKKKRTSSATDRSEVNARVADRITSASDLPQRARILVYGRSGRRKTRTASTAPKVLLIDVNEEGTDSVRNDLDPDVYRVYYWTEMDDVYWFLQSGDHEYESFAIDGLTSMQNLCMKFVLGDEASRDASRDPDMPSRQIYGKVSELMKTQVTNFRNLPMNAVFTALERTKTSGEDDLDEQPYTSPALSPAVSGHVEAAVGLIGYMTYREVVVKKGGRRRRVKRSRMMLGDSERYLTKDRYGLEVDYIDAPNIETIIELIYEDRKG